VAASHHARTAAYDVVLLAHVLSALVGLGAVTVAGAYARALRAGLQSESVRRYYRPGVNWAGRVLVLVPVLGVALMAMSQGDFSFSDGWVAAGLMLWTVAVVAAEAVLWPAERRLRTAVADPSSSADLRGPCLRVMTAAGGVVVVLVVATVVMVAKP
jgi:hypothetical protein